MTIFLGFTTGLFLGALVTICLVAWLQDEIIKNAHDTILECNETLLEVDEKLYRNEETEAK